MSRRGILPPNKKLEPFMSPKSKAPRCQAVKAPLEGKKFGEQCKKSCVDGRPYCKYHGGKAGRPIVTGEHSKYNPVPKDLSKNFERAMNDPELLNMQKEIALLDTQIWTICEAAKDNAGFTQKESKILMGLMNQKQRLIGQEVQTRVAMGSFIEVSQVLMILNRVYQSILVNVKDETARRRVGADIRSIVGPSGDVVVQG